jgi:thiol-disulfide isomerase/thioredoxin
MRRSNSSNRGRFTVIGVLASVGLIYFASTQARFMGKPELSGDQMSPGNARIERVSFFQPPALSFSGAVDWINSGPITLSELKGKIVLLDFWTYCCINCHHVLPDLAKLEEKYKNELVVIGVHSGKFNAERDTENIRRKVREYRIKHPVINDAKMTLWRRFGVNSWPTLVLLDANGGYLGSVSGEGHYDVLDRAIGKLVEEHKAKGDLNLAPLKFSPEMERPSDGPLLFPGKILADEAGKRLFITDTGHNRIIQTALDGTKPVVIGDGEEGMVDGEFAKARFNRPQGLWLNGETLYVADTENHAIRAIDLSAGTVATVAGTGAQARSMATPGEFGPAKTTPMSSPWDITQVKGDNALYIAMAGPHQIWKLDLAADKISVYAGTGNENIRDGSADTANFAQPSGITSDGKNLFIADSEVSGIREIKGVDTRVPEVHTIVGMGLFDFGDKDGHAANVRLQHCLGVSYAGGHLYIADTYNNKIKICDPQRRSVKTLVGTHQPGDGDTSAHFYQPGGVSATETHLYVADTNNHKIKVVDLKTDAVHTLVLEGLTAPKPRAHKPSFPNSEAIKLPPVEAAAGKTITLAVTVPVARGYKLNAEAPLTYVVEAPEQSGILAPETPIQGKKLKPPVHEFPVTVTLAKPAAAGETLDLKLSLLTLVCKESSNLCQIKSYVWSLPVKFTSGGSSEPIKIGAP